MSIFENVSSTVVRLLALLSLSLLAAPALAQSPPPTGFTLDSGKPSGGTASGSSPSSQYATNGASRGGNAYGTGADSCSGPITYSWTWQEPGPAPSCVVLKVQTSASWTGPPGACDDGLDQSDPVHSSYAGPTLVSQTQSGTAYVVEQVQQGGTVQYQISPSSSATSSNCSVSASVTLTPIHIDLGGVTNVGNNPHLLVGQRLNAVMDTGNYSVDTYTWSVSGGKPFNYYYADQSRGYLDSFALPIGADLACCFAAPEDDGVTVLVCPPDLKTRRLEFSA